MGKKVSQLTGKELEECIARGYDARPAPLARGAKKGTLRNTYTSEAQIIADLGDNFTQDYLSRHLTDETPLTTRQWVNLDAMRLNGAVRAVCTAVLYGRGIHYASPSALADLETASAFVLAKWEAYLNRLDYQNARILARIAAGGSYFYSNDQFKVALASAQTLTAQYRARFEAWSANGALTPAGETVTADRRFME